MTPATATAALSEAEAGQFISFTIDREEYGVDIMEVREIKGWMETTRLPNAPSFVRGIINLRGLMVPVLDLRARFGKGETQPTKSHVTVIVAVGNRTVGILVDAVSDILTVTETQIKPPPEMDTDPAHAYIRGLVAIDERMVALLKLDRLFDLSDLHLSPTNDQ